MKSVRAGERAKRASRGFTMVELLVALTAGLLVSSSAYVLARNSMRSYQDESRIAASQVGVSVGMNRIQSELQRAAYMSSPNSATDPTLCGTIPGGVVFRGLQIFTRGSLVHTLTPSFGYESGDNVGISSPDMVIVTGNMTSTEQLEYRLVDGSDKKMYMAMDRGPMQRLIQSLGHNATAVKEVFMPHTSAGVKINPRFARVIDQTGKASYIQVTDVDVQKTGTLVTAVTLTIATASGGDIAALPLGTECGFVNRGGGLMNPVSIIRYRVGRPTVTSYNLATAPAGAVEVTGEDIRTELLREEISPGGLTNRTSITLGVSATGLSSQEIAAEFAVALEFAAYERSGAGLVFRDFDDDTGIDAILPQNFRALGVRLSTRARMPDRDAVGPDGIVSRVMLPTVDGRQRYARLRTLQTQIQLPNLAGVTF